MIAPSRETIAKRIKAGWEPERARTLAPLKVGNSIKAEFRPYIYPKDNKFYGNVRGPGDKRIYLGTYPTRLEAENAAALYLLTGEKPPRKARKQRTPRDSKLRPARKPQPPKIKAQPTATRQNNEYRIAIMRQIWKRLK
jgi:hypothetical protein